jgi:imidazole glycerol-phosphate synthase subunit HisH
MIVIIDYKMGNIGSIANMLKKIGANSCVSNEAEVIMKADKIILPGVGSFDSGITNLIGLGLDDILKENVFLRKKPVLGICLGMQLFANKSEEGILPGLGFINAEVKKFDFAKKEYDKILKVPHMGWNGVRCIKDSPILRKRIDQEDRFYFVHSYYVDCFDKEDVIGISHYGIDFISAYCKDNIMGVQFHPEKSHKYGIELFKNFAAI